MPLSAGQVIPARSHRRRRPVGRGRARQAWRGRDRRESSLSLRSPRVVGDLPIAEARCDELQYGGSTRAERMARGAPAESADTLLQGHLLAHAVPAEAARANAVPQRSARDRLRVALESSDTAQTKGAVDEMWARLASRMAGCRRPRPPRTRWRPRWQVNEIHANTLRSQPARFATWVLALARAASGSLATTAS